MLLTFFLSIIYALLTSAMTWFINALPQLNFPVWAVPSSMSNIINFCNYFLPMNAVWQCLQIMLGLTVARITIAVLLRIKSFIPLISG